MSEVVGEVVSEVVGEVVGELGSEMGRGVTPQKTARSRWFRAIL